MRWMTLRVRLVFALAALMTIGLAVFGIATYSLYARSRYQRLDDQLRSASPAISRLLDAAAGFDQQDPRNPQQPPNGAPPIVAPITVYGVLRAADGTVLAELSPSDLTARPTLPAHLVAAGFSPQLSTVGSSDGSGDWRMLVMADRDGRLVVVAVPLSEVHSTLRHLVLIEALASGGLLVVLAGGAWLILRRGLRPLEAMATTARQISTGELEARVATGDSRSEVDELGRAFNGMLDDLEVAFAQRDATELRLRQFLSDASHELRTPLTSIQGFAELFRLGADRDHVDREITVRRIESEATRMAALVDDLLLLARLDETRPADRHPVDLSVLAADACSDAVALDPARHVTLDAPNPTIVRGDQLHLRQAITNLVENAVRHTPAGTPLEVATHVHDNSGFLTVRDHGPGLGDDALEHVFDRFWQADRARTGRGAGLGLAIVAGIAEEHGGTASVANAPDGGAVFTLRIPL